MLRIVPFFYVSVVLAVLLVGNTTSSWARTRTCVVQEIIVTDSYTYILCQGSGDVWLAALLKNIVPGEQLSYTAAPPVINFRSKSLGRVFPKMIVSEVWRGGEARPVYYAPPVKPAPFAPPMEPAPSAPPLEPEDLPANKEIFSSTDENGTLVFSDDPDKVRGKRNPTGDSGRSITIGAPLPKGAHLLASPENPPSSYFDKSKPLAGSAGLEDAVRKGFLRKATAKDVQSWVDAVTAKSLKGDVTELANQNDRYEELPVEGQSYVVLKEFVFPAGLYGGNLGSFIIPKGVPFPKGDPGHSMVYDFNTLAVCWPGSLGGMALAAPVASETLPVQVPKVARIPDEHCSATGPVATERSCLALELERADTEINVVYQQLVAGLDPPERDNLRKQQRAWLIARDNVCRLQTLTTDKAAWLKYVLANDDRALCVTGQTKERLAFLQGLQDTLAFRESTSPPLRVEASIVPSRNERDYLVNSRGSHSSGKWYFEVQIDHGKITEKMDASLFLGVDNTTETFGTLYHIRPQDMVLKVGDGSITIVGGNLGPDIRLPKVTVGIAVDLDNGKIYHHRDGYWRNGLPGTAQGMDVKLGRTYRAGIISSIPLTELIDRGVVTFNMGERPFEYLIPAGHAPFDAAKPAASKTVKASKAVAIMPPCSSVAGKASEYWLRKYFAWSRSVGAKAKPSTDTTGKRSASGQSGPVWFLTGSESSEPVVRSCVIPGNVTLLVPVLNSLAQATKGHVASCAELVDPLSSFNSAGVYVYLTVDGKDVENLTHYQAETGCFQLNDVANGQKGLAAGNGYWVFLNPLPPGNHIVKFGGKYLADGFSQDITYRITVK